MAASADTLINWYEQRIGIYYSMANRFGLESYDCSSALFFALRSAGYIDNNLMGNTDDLFRVLPDAGFTRTTEPVRGDIFLWGRSGYAGGYYGHCGVFTDDERDIISCNRIDNGITKDNYDDLRSRYSNPPQVIYHYETDEEDSEDDSHLVNVGEMDLLGIKEGKVVAEGWHYSYGKNTEQIVLINAVTNKEITRTYAPAVSRPDLAEAHPGNPGIENSGFHAEFEIENETSVYVKGIRSDGMGNRDELIFPSIITYEQAFDIDVDEYAGTNVKFWFEIYDKDVLKARGNKILNTLTWENELMYVPVTEIVLPIDYTDYITGREEIKIYVNKKVFHGIVTEFVQDKENEVLNIQLTHVISEWEYRQISTNLACKNRTVNDIYSTLDFRYPGWNIDYLNNSANTVIDYVYSRQNKLDGLTKTMELTEDLYWRVGFAFGRKLETGSFGDDSGYFVSRKRSSAYNIQMITDPVILHEFENVINIATVYGEKSDSGMSSMSLREVYREPGAQYPGFPVRILKNGINNERPYDYVEFASLAPNTEIEYSVIDEESVMLEGDIAIEGSFSFNDLAPFNVDGEYITDEDRAKAAQTAYEAAVKKLKESRRRFTIEIQVEELPETINPGDRIRLIYDNSNFIPGECSDYMKQILNMNDLFYITRIQYEIDQSGIETNTLHLSKFLHTERETDQQ